MCSAGAFGFNSSHESSVEGCLPYDLLQQRDTIKWYQSFLLYEDNLHDFGYVMAECRIVRVELGGDV